MSNQWKDRLIRGGYIAMAVVAGFGWGSAFVAIALGTPAAGRASVILLLTAAGIGLACVIAVNFPKLPADGQTQAPPQQCCPWMLRRRKA